MHIGKRSFPGRRTLEEWLAIPFRARIPLVWRAQADLFGSFRFCTDKRAAGTACAAAARTPRPAGKGLARQEGRRKGVPKTMWKEWARIQRSVGIAIRAPHGPQNGRERTG